MGLLSSLLGRPTARLAKGPRRTHVEALEERRVMAADVLLGAVYLEDSLSGQDDNGDVIRVSFVGGAPGTTLGRVVIDGDKAGDGATVADVFFDSAAGGAGAFDAVGLSILGQAGFTIDSVEVLDGGQTIAFNLTGFEAGEELIFSIDVDEFGQSRGVLTANAFAEGGEFEGSHLRGEFSAPGFVDLSLAGVFFDAFDPDFAAAEAAAGSVLARLPGDDYDDPNGFQVPVRTAGAVAHAPQIELARLSGYVYHDRDDDGLRDAGEEPIAGVRVELLDAAGAGTGVFTTTNSNGFYEFVDLVAGTYGVRETQPTGWFDGKDTAGSNGGVAGNDIIRGASLAFGDRATEYNFGELLGGSISGRVHAMDGPDCDYENPDVLLSGVTIELLDASGAVLQTTTTDAQGRYSFTGLRPGSYQVRETQPTGYYDGDERVGTAGGVATNDLVSGITIGSDVDAVNYDFCEHIGADLSGFVYHDRDDDGVRDPGEEPIPGATLKLLREDGTDTGQRAVTDSRGFYRFTNLERGKYRVMEIQPIGWLDGKDTPGSLGGIADNPGDMIRMIMLDYGDDATEYNFGELLPASIAGRVHSSPTGDCENDPNAAPIAGVTVQLLDSSGTVLRTTITNSLGEYRFDGLAPGRYQVRELQPTGYFDGLSHLGSAGGVAGSNLFSQIAIGSGVNAIDYDFCETPPAALSGFVFVDGAPIFSVTGLPPEDIAAVRNGARTTDDTPIAGVRLRLVDGSTGQPFYRLAEGETEFDVPDGFVGIEVLPGAYPDGVFEATTDASGYYEFRGLPTGFYAVVESQPLALFDGIDTPGSGGGVAVNPPRPGEPIQFVPLVVRYGNDLIFGVRATAGTTAVENNFSEVRTTFGFLPPETPETPPRFTPPLPITPGRRPGPEALAPPARPEDDFIGGSAEVVGYAWHLSVINAGAPRELARDQPAVAFVSRTDDPAWRGSERTANELRQAQWKMLADDVPGAPLEDLLFGVADAVPVAGDWDGDGVTDVGVFLDGDWYLDLDGNGEWGTGDLWAKLGSADDLPVTGDWDGDGKTDIGIYGPAWPRDPYAIEREPGMPDAANRPGPLAGKAKNVPPTEEEATSGARLLAKLRAQIAARRTDRIDHVFHYGTPGDAPVAGDWNGDGVRSIGVFRDGEWTLDTTGDGRLDESDRRVALGQSGDRPIVGDWDGDGRDDLGVYRGGEWFVDPDGDGRLESLRLAATDQALAVEGGAPVVGDWDGDGRDEPALVVPVTGGDGGAGEVRVSQREAG